MIKYPKIKEQYYPSKSSSNQNMAHLETETLHGEEKDRYCTTYNPKQIWSVLSQEEIHDIAYEILRLMPISQDGYDFYLEFKSFPNRYPYYILITRVGSDWYRSHHDSGKLTDIMIKLKADIIYALNIRQTDNNEVSSKPIYSSYSDPPTRYRAGPTISAIDNNALLRYSDSAWAKEPNVLLSRVPILPQSTEIKHGVEERWFIFSNKPLALHYWLDNKEVTKVEYVKYLQTRLDTILNLPMVLTDLICQY